MIDVKEIADGADVIMNGYMFTKCKLGFRVLNLNRPEGAVFLPDEKRGFRDYNR